MNVDWRTVKTRWSFVRQQFALVPLAYIASNTPKQSVVDLQSSIHNDNSMWIPLLFLSLLVVRLSNAQDFFEPPTISPPDSNTVTAAPTLSDTNTSMPVALNSTAPSMAPNDAVSSPAPSIAMDNNTTMPPTTMTNVTSPPTLAPIVTDEIPSKAPVVAPIAPTPPRTTPNPSAEIHDKDQILDPKSKDSREHGVGNDGISASAIFGMVVAIGLVFVGAFFVFGKQRGGGGRRDGMREMEMSTWVNNNDDGLL